MSPEPTPIPGTATRIRRAGPADAAAIAQLREAAARWLLARGIDQWRPGEITEAHVLDWLAGGRVYLIERDGVVVAAVRVAWADPAVWGDQLEIAGYLHALVSSRAQEDRGLGAVLLGHAEEVIARTGRHMARLDCRADNLALRAYYRRAGYDEVGTRDFPDHPDWRPVTLLEKRLS
jgi:protein-tyrosine phosphatase